MKKKLVLFSSAFNIDDYASRPLPDDIFNSEGAILAHKGHTLTRERLINSYVYVDDRYVAGEIPAGTAGKTDPQPASVAPPGIPPAQPAPAVQRKDDYPAGFELTDNYEEDSADKIETYLSDLDFEPIPKIKASLRTNIHGMKDIFRKKIVNNMVFLASADNEKITRQIAEYLDHILNTNLFASDYIDMITAIRTRNNYVTFSHSLTMAFYTMAIAKKLKMLREDYLVNDNLGRWVPVKTRKNPRLYSPVPFSSQLLKYFDRQKSTIMVKYDGEVRDVLLERLHDLMHEYSKLDPKKNRYQSLAPAYDENMLIILTMAAINCDIGKLCIPNRILNKRADLTDEEWNLLRQHPALSVSKLKEVNVDLPKMFVHIIGHHVTDDETGYPKVKGALPPETKILTVADIYDAMTAPRHYGTLHSSAEAVNAIRGMHEKGFIDLPLYLAAVHTFEEYNHEFVKRRHKKMAESADAEEGD